MFLFKKNSLPWLWLSLLIVIADQLSKYWVVSHVDYQNSLHVLPFLNVSLAHNAGVAFSFFSRSGGWQVYFFVTFALLVTFFLVRWLKRTSRDIKWRGLALALIIGGALGNVIDRVRLHYVVDFADFHVNSWHFATFNIADSAVSIGALLLAFSLWYKPDNRL